MTKRRNTKTEWTPPSRHTGPWGFDVVYNTERDCDANGCDGMCRCGRIVNAHVESVNMASLVSHTLNDFKDDTLPYFIDRLFSIHQLWNPSKWEVLVGRGYYGEEVDGVSVEDYGTINAIYDTIRTLIPLDLTGRVELILKEEYGFLLPQIQDQQWVIEKVDPSCLRIPNDYYRGKVAQQGSKYLPDTPPYPIGIYLQVDGFYQVIDGYHRYLQYVVNQKCKSVEIITTS